MKGQQTLAQLPLMVPAVVRVVNRDDSRLSDLGFFCGSYVTALFDCPLGGTRLYFIRGMRLALRQKEAEQIAVEVVEDGTCENSSSGDAQYGQEHVI